MLSLIKKNKIKVLLLGAHSDDIEIGCGGTVLKLKEHYSYIDCDWIVFSSNKIRKEEGVKSAQKFLKNYDQKMIKFLDFQDAYFEDQIREIKNFFENLKKECNPDIIFTHYRNDLHQDHRIINQLTWNTFRNQLVLEYEIMKYDGDIGNPNVYVSLNNEIVENKVNIIMQSFESQKNKIWFSEDTFKAIMRIRGVETNKFLFAESFYARKILI